MAGQTIAHYEILGKLGEGGMGVVSLARDTRLGRQVALKLLRPEATPDAERKQRFLQEARAASALNHPNIITIYEVGSSAEGDFIAMEYAQGRLLEEVIGRRGLPVRQALSIALQVAAALDAAHNAGIVHRDLKPTNVVLTSTGLVKVLDFGLAKLMEDSAQDGHGEHSTATRDTPHTAAGVILGTVAYMSPEQACGKPVDARSDIYSFGSLLYEMLTGRRAFNGDSNAAIISAILRDDPRPMRAVADDIPRDLERVVRRCLRKDPARRFQDMADLRVALEELREDLDSGALDQGLAAPAPSRRASLLMPLLVALALAMVGLAWWKLLKPQTARTPVLTRLTSDSGYTAFPAISQDGKMVAYASDSGAGGNLDIWVQQVAGGNRIRLTTHEADDYEPCFSPDGSNIVFRSERDGGGIYLISALGGDARLMARQGRSPVFSPDGRHIAYSVGPGGVGATFSYGASSLYVAPISGGEPRRLQAGFAVALHPAWSGNKHIVFLGAKELGPPVYDWWVSPIDGGAAIDSGALRSMRERGYVVAPLPFSVNGSEIVFSVGRGDTINLWRATLDSGWKINWPPEQITSGTGQEVQPALAAGGRIVFTSGVANTDVWSLPLDANTGKVTGPPRQLTRDAASDSYPEISADGRQVAFISHRLGSDDVWVLDMESGRQTAMLATPARELYPRFSRDARLLAYTSFQDGKRSIFLKQTDSGLPRQLCEDCGIARDLSADGRFVLVQTGRVPHVNLLEVDGGAARTIYRHPRFPIYAPRFSPGQNWVAFQMIEHPGARRIVAAPFRNGAGAPESEWISITDGKSMDRNPFWSPDGKLIYFVSERDTFRCVWAQRVDESTRRPLGEAFAVTHFHDPVRSMMNLEGPGQVSLTVAADAMVFALGERSGNIWLAEMR